MSTHSLPEDNSQVLEWVRQFLVTDLGVRKELVTFEAELVKDLGATSLVLVSLVLELEEHYHLTISDEAATKISTVGDVITLIQRQRS